MPVVEDSDQVLPLLSCGDQVITDDGPGTLVSVQFQTAQYNGAWELEPPSLVVELDSGQTIHTCLCSITLPRTKLGTKLLHREFDRLWPPKTDGVPEDSRMLIPEGSEDLPDIREGTEKEATMRNRAAGYDDDVTLQRAVQELFREEDLDPEDFDVEDGYQGVEVRPLAGYSPEFIVVESYDEAVKQAEDRVRDDLENEPELFNQSWLMYYVDEDRLRDALYQDEYSMTHENIMDDVETDPQAAAEQMGIDTEAYENEDYELVDERGLKDALEDRVDDYVEATVQDRLQDPMEYLRDMLGDAEGTSAALKWGGIDYDRAVDDAVSTDGPGHFLSTYDGNIEELPSGGVYWRTN